MPNLAGDILDATTDAARIMKDVGWAFFLLMAAWWLSQAKSRIVFEIRQPEEERRNDA